MYGCRQSSESQESHETRAGGYGIKIYHIQLQAIPQNGKESHETKAGETSLRVSARQARLIGRTQSAVSSSPKSSNKPHRPLMSCQDGGTPSSLLATTRIDPDVTACRISALPAHITGGLPLSVHPATAELCATKHSALLATQSHNSTDQHGIKPEFWSCTSHCFIANRCLCGGAHQNNMGSMCEAVSVGIRTGPHGMRTGTPERHRGQPAA